MMVTEIMMMIVLMMLLGDVDTNAQLTEVTASMSKLRSWEVCDGTFVTSLQDRE